MERNSAARSGFTLLEVIVVIVALIILAAFAANKFLRGTYKVKIASIANDMKVLRTAEDQFSGDLGRFAFAARCFVDPNWASFSDVCGNSANWKGPYIDKTVSEWVDCTEDPTASETDKAGCYALAFGTIEITNGKGTHGAIVVKGLDEQAALDVYANLTGGETGIYTSYASAQISKTEAEGMSTGAWVEQDPNDSTKYNVYLNF